MNSIKMYDDDAIKLLALGNEEAFVHFFDRYQAAVFGTALEFSKSKERAKEIVEKVFLKVWQNHKHFNDVAELEKFIRTTATDVILDYLKKLKN